jgi:hypothetical protein
MWDSISVNFLIGKSNLNILKNIESMDSKTWETLNHIWNNLNEQKLNEKYQKEILNIQT